MVVKRYAEQCRNGIEMWIKNHMITTLIKFGYGVETAAGEKPSSFTWLERCNNINGINLATEIIDASALEDYVTRKIAGRQDAGRLVAA